MAREKGSHPGRIRLAGAGVRLRREQQLIEAFGSADREHRQVDHRGSPQLTIGERELQPQAAHRIRSIADIGLAAPERERPITGTRRGRKTTASERRTAFPLPSKYPETPTPLAWLRRNPAWSPSTCSNASVNRSGVRSFGVSHPPRWRNVPPTAASTRPIPAGLAST